MEVELKAPLDTQVEVPHRHRRHEPEIAPWQELRIFPPGHFGRKGQRAGVRAAARQPHERYFSMPQFPGLKIAGSLSV